MKNFKILTLSLIYLFSMGIAQDDSLAVNKYKQQVWGIGGMMRLASIPFDTDGEAKEVSTFIPLLYFENDHFFYNGLTGGFKAWQNESWRISVISRIHFFDIPEKYQNQLLGDNADWGAQLRYMPTDWSYLDAEFLMDLNLNPLANLTYGISTDNYPFMLDAWAELKYKSQKYNSFYYGLEPLTGISVSPGADLSVGARVTYHVFSSFFIYGAAEFTRIGEQARAVPHVEDDYTWEVYLGIAFSNDRTKPQDREIKNKAYIRVAHARATPTSLWDNVFLQTKPDSNHNSLSSVFYGYPLTDEVFGLPLEMYIMPGIAYHWPSRVQSEALEFIISIKADYTIPLPWRIRLGMAEGISYITEVTYIEKSEVEDREFRPSQKLNYLDFTIDISMGDIFGAKGLSDLWLGYYIHHRSGIWGNAQQYGRINGGSNYTGVYFQYHY